MHEAIAEFHRKSEKARTNRKSDLQICGEGRKSRKTPMLVVGKKPNEKSQFKTLLVMIAKRFLPPWGLRGKPSNQQPSGEPLPAAPFNAGHGSNEWRISVLFGAALLAYVAISACSIRAPFFPGDDDGEIYFVRTSASWLSLLGPDFFHFFRPVKNLLFVFLTG